MLCKRKTRWNVVVVLLCLMLAGFVSTGLAKVKKPVETRYKMIDLGAFGDVRSSSSGINNLGQVIGGSSGRGFIVNPLDSDDDGEPDTWFVDDGVGGNALMIDLGTLATNEGSDSLEVGPLAINDFGQVVGYSNTDEYTRAFILTPEDTDGDGTPDLWNKDDNGDGANDLMVNLGNLPPGDRSSIAYAISNSGYVVGNGSGCYSCLNVGHGFVIAPKDSDGDGEPDTWFTDEDGDGLNDLMIDLGLLDAEHYCSYAYGVNDSGEVVGWSGTALNYAFVITPEDVDGNGELDWFSDGGDGTNALMTKLEPVVEGAVCAAVAINSSGQVVGSSSISASQLTQFQTATVIWEADTTTPTLLPGDIKGGARPYGMNDMGDTVGYGLSAVTPINAPEESNTNKWAAFVCEYGGVMTLLSNLIEEGFLTDDLIARDINDSGHIVGMVLDDINHAYIAVPIPENSQP